VSRYVADIFTKELMGNAHYKNGKFKEALDETFKRVDELIESQEGQAALNKIRNGKEVTNQ
jgi:hypothetical protein